MLPSGGDLAQVVVEVGLHSSTFSRPGGKVIAVLRIYEHLFPVLKKTLKFTKTSIASVLVSHF